MEAKGLKLTHPHIELLLMVLSLFQLVSSQTLKDDVKELKKDNTKFKSYLLSRNYLDKISSSPSEEEEKNNNE
jgi:hypothetical protein